MHISWARLASFCHLGVISDPQIVSKFHNETHDPKGQENKIYTIVKGRETFYRRHTVPVPSCSEIKYVLKRGILKVCFSWFGLAGVVFNIFSETANKNSKYKCYKFTIYNVEPKTMYFLY